MTAFLDAEGQQRPPYRQDFNGGGLPNDPFWSFNSTTNGRIQLAPGEISALLSPATGFSATAGNRFRGNVIEVTNTVVLAGMDYYLERPGFTRVDFMVYESLHATGRFERIYMTETFANPGDGYVASGEMLVTLQAGRHYLVGAAWDANATYYYAIALSSPVATPFGAFVGSETGSTYPAPASFMVEPPPAGYGYDIRLRTLDDNLVAADAPSSGTNADMTRGNFIACDTNETLHRVSVLLGRSTATEVSFGVYESTTSNGVYSLLATNQVTAPAGTNYVLSGSLDAGLQAGRFYLITASWNENSRYFYQNAPAHPQSLTIGETFGGHFRSAGDLPASLNAPSANANAYAMTLHAGDAGAVRMDSDRSLAASTNEMILQLDLSGYTNALVQYTHLAAQEESGEDGVFISGDTNTWFPVELFTNGPAVAGETRSFDVVSVANANGIALDDSVYLRWQQADDFPWPLDGRAFGEILVSTPPDLRIMSATMNLVSDQITVPAPLIALRGTNDPFYIDVQTEFELHGGTNDLTSQSFDLTYQVKEYLLATKWSETETLVYDMPAYSEQSVTRSNRVTVPAGIAFSAIAIETVPQLDSGDELAESIESNNEGSALQVLNHYSGRLWFDDVPTAIWVTNWTTRTFLSATNHTISGTGVVQGLSFSFANLDVDKNPGTLDYHIAPSEMQVITTEALAETRLNNVYYTAPAGIGLSRSGAKATLEVTLPSGLGYSASISDQNLAAVLTLNNVSLNAVLEPKINPVYAGTLFFAEETKPLMLGVSSVTWIPRNGAFELISNGQLAYVRDDELNTLDAYASGGLITPGAALRRSNEQYYRFASVTAGDNITVWASDDAAAEISLDIDLGPGSFTTHMPYNTAVDWSGNGILRVEDDFLDLNSVVDQPAPLLVEYLQGCPGDCPGAGQSAKLIMSDDDVRLEFAGNGGLVAGGTLDNTNEIAWGFITGLTNFAQQVDGLSNVHFYMAGHFLRGDELDASLGADDAPGVILYAGVRTNAAKTAERPWKAAYLNGLADYPGMNFRNDAGLMSGTSILGGDEFSGYPLTTRSKYYARPSGVSGIHEADSFPAAGQIYGYDFTFSNYGLNYLSNSNRDSRTDGSVEVVYRSIFTTSFEELRFSCLGDLLDAQLADPGRLDTLDYWDAPFIALNIGFERNQTCDVGTGFLTMQVQSWADHVEDPLFGKFGWKSDGNLLTAHDAITDIKSRLSLPNDIPVDGPGDEAYTLFPVNEAYLNTYANAGIANANGDGFVSLAGTLDVTFFEDLLVHVHTGAGTNGTSQFHMMGGWPDQGWVMAGEDFFSHSLFDDRNWGYPDNVGGLEVSDYRDQSLPQYQVRARRTWLEVVEFNYPLTWSYVTRSFVSADPVVNDLMVLSV
ncbi:MAG: hypothetical protein ACO398_07450 [Kiritimatiellia bacterium]